MGKNKTEYSERQETILQVNKIQGYSLTADRQNMENMNRTQFIQCWQWNSQNFHFETHLLVMNSIP